MKIVTIVLAVILYGFPSLSQNVLTADDLLKAELDKNASDKKISANNAIKDFVETKPKQQGAINWTKGLMEAEGVCYFKDEQLQKMGKQYVTDLCIAGAEADGRANLLAMVLGTQIYDTITMSNLMVEKKVTVQIAEGYIRAYRVGDVVVKENSVRVKMRINLYGDSSVADFVINQQLLPQQQVSMQETEAMNKVRDNIGQMAMKEYKEIGLLPQDATNVPPFVINIPKSDKQQYSPGLVPTVVVKDLNGQETKIDLSKWIKLNSNSEKTFQIIQASKDFINNAGLLKNVPVLDGYVRNNEIIVDLNKMNSPTQPPQKKKLAQVLSKVGNVLLQALPIVAAIL